MSNLKHRIEEACEQIDTGFSADAFDNPEALAEIENYLSRWRRKIAAIKGRRKDLDGILRELLSGLAQGAEFISRNEGKDPEFDKLMIEPLKKIENHLSRVIFSSKYSKIIQLERERCLKLIDSELEPEISDELWETMKRNKNFAVKVITGLVTHSIRAKISS